MITTDSAIRALDPIGLDELVRRAPLLNRLDRKYILPVAELPTLLSGLPTGVRVLDIDQRREFPYRSSYFDTRGLDCYLAAARSRRRRYKVRVRSYVDSDQHFLEVKTRGPRGRTVKDRIPYAGDVDHLGADARVHLDGVLAHAGFDPESVEFDVALTTRYQRITLYAPATHTRVTIDTGLMWTLPGGESIRVLDRAIVETKSDRATSDIDRLLWSLKHRPCSVSKYGTGLAALRPDLPSHRWHPVLRRHLATTLETLS